MSQRLLFSKGDLVLVKGWTYWNHSAIDVTIPGKYQKYDGILGEIVEILYVGETSVGVFFQGMKYDLKPELIEMVYTT